ncbi:uncharacterized protein BHQ10_004286 [Talaromyces amestolkiae]|uniref:Uncharacterized protein n=1 Tax=Talaromyces amestolkiae TaxID=1196081 RepID=A0A364KXJ9_TALAM|nr:uncharacterized protein BHQ10_004286 [Talaromyces amestolkiae]RAO68274.1 hypothetical protein BHQ10_004286 [Talaromyces amestolkiae]
MATVEAPVSLRDTVNQIDLDVKFNGEEINGARIKSKLGNLFRRNNQSGLDGSISITEQMSRTSTSTTEVDNASSSTATGIYTNGVKEELTNGILEENGAVRGVKPTGALRGIIEGVGSGAWEDRTFPCQKHERPSRFPEPDGPLPFPKEMRDLVAWTDSFVEHLGWIALRGEQDITGYKARLRNADNEKITLTKEITDLQNQLKAVNKTVENMRQKNDTLSSEIKVLELDKAAVDKRIVELKEQNSQLDQERWQLSHDKETLINANESLTRMLNELTTKYELNEDHLHDLQKKLDDLNDEDLRKIEERESTIFKLQQVITSKQETIDSLTTALAAAEAALIVAEDKVDSLTKRLSRAETARDEAVAQLNESKGEVRTLKGTNAGLEENIRVLQRDIAHHEEDIGVLKGQLAEASTREKEARAAVVSVQEHARTHWSTLQNIRVVGGWFRQNDWDVCDTVVPDPVSGRPSTTHGKYIPPQVVPGGETFRGLPIQPQPIVPTGTAPGGSVGPSQPEKLPKPVETSKPPTPIVIPEPKPVTQGTKEPVRTTGPEASRPVVSDTTRTSAPTEIPQPKPASKTAEPVRAPGLDVSTPEAPSKPPTVPASVETPIPGPIKAPGLDVSPSVTPHQSVPIKLDPVDPAPADPAATIQAPTPVQSEPVNTPVPTSAANPQSGPENPGEPDLRAPSPAAAPASAQGPAPETHAPVEQPASPIQGSIPKEPELEEQEAGEPDFSGPQHEPSVDEQDSPDISEGGDGDEPEAQDSTEWVVVDMENGKVLSMEVLAMIGRDVMSARDRTIQILMRNRIVDGKDMKDQAPGDVERGKGRVKDVSVAMIVD